MDVVPNYPKYVCARNHCDLSVPAEVLEGCCFTPVFKGYSGNEVIIGKILENVDVLIHSRELEHVLKHWGNWLRLLLLLGLGNSNW